MAKHYTLKNLAGTMYTNSVYIGNKLTDAQQYYLVRSNSSEYIFRCAYSEQLNEHQCALSSTHRNLLKISANDTITFLPVEDHSYQPIKSMSVTFKPMSKSDVEMVEIKMEQFLKTFKETFGGLVVTEHFQLILQVNGIYFICEISDFKFDKLINTKFGLLLGNTLVSCNDNSYKIDLIQKKPLFKNVIDLQQMGIGGLSNEFAIIFRRLFASRLLSQNLLNEMNIHHIRGMIIHGPPGCGKTLLARQIGQLLNCEHPKLVNGPELLNMYVGESEANTRKLFEDAISDKDMKNLHLIICDEFDALCRHRGKNVYNNPVMDNVVNTLLSYIDGVNQLNNILFICMTNRIDLIDPAMLRPGRIELQIGISLPDKEGRSEILKIHTSSIVKNGYLASDVDFEQLATKTKYFTGAEIEGLVKNASSYAISRNVDKNMQVNKKPIIRMNDFITAIDEITPMFGGISHNILDISKNKFIPWGDYIKNKFNLIVDNINQLRLGHSLSVVIDGRPYTGKTFMSTHVVRKLMPDYARMIDPITLVGKNDIEKCHIIQQTFDHANNSTFSIIIIDTFERLIEWCPVGSILNNQILQTILTMLRQNICSKNKLSILVTCYDYNLLKKLEVDNLFDLRVTIPHIIEPQSAKTLGVDITENTELSIVLHQLTKL